MTCRSDVDSNVFSVPDFRYVQFFDRDEPRMEMLSCWPQDNGGWLIEKASREETGHWSPPTRTTFKGSLEQLAEFAREAGYFRQVVIRG